MSGTAITFNSYSLQSSNYRTEKISHLSPPDRELDIYKRAREHGQLIVSDWRSARRIMVTGHVIGANAAEFKTKVDDLLENLAGIGKNLDIEYGGGTRRYIATLEKADIPRSGYHNSFVPFSLTFICVDPFGYDTSTTTDNEAAIVASPHTYSVDFTGSGPPLPVITITINSGTSVSIIHFKNNTLDDEIIVGTSFITSDVLEIDCENKTVKLNGTELDYTGIFPAFQAGSNSLTLEVTASAFNIDVDIEYTPTYL